MLTLIVLVMQSSSPTNGCEKKHTFCLTNWRSHGNYLFYKRSLVPKCAALIRRCAVIGQMFTAEEESLRNPKSFCIGGYTTSELKEDLASIRVEGCVHCICNLTYLMNLTKLFFYCIAI